MPFTLGFQKKLILNPWSMHISPLKVSFNGFAILFKVLSAHCGLFLDPFFPPWSKKTCLICRLWCRILSNWPWFQYPWILTVKNQEMLFPILPYITYYTLDQINFKNLWQIAFLKKKIFCSMNENKIRGGGVFQNYTLSFWESEWYAPLNPPWLAGPS